MNAALIPVDERAVQRDLLMAALQRCPGDLDTALARVRAAHDALADLPYTWPTFRRRRAEARAAETWAHLYETEQTNREAVAA